MTTKISEYAHLIRRECRLIQGGGEATALYEILYDY